MTHFAQLNKSAAVVTATNFALVVTTFESVQPASAFPDIAARLVADGTGLSRPGMYYDGTSFGFTPVTLGEARSLKQAALDSFFSAHFDLAAFIRDGTATTITATQIGTFLATITNNYRTLRASIAAAGTIAAVTAIDVTAGWPSNP